MSHAAIDDRLTPLVGRTLRSVEKLDSTWAFVFDSDVVLQTDADWRLVMGGRIRASSPDHGHVFGLPAPVDVVPELRACVAGRIVARASIVPETGDLMLTFEPPARLELFQLSTGYEAWGLSTPRGRLICMGGGRIVPVPRE